MCFSPQASFIASIFLTGIAIASYCKTKKAQVHVSAKLGLVLIPAGFALQQLCEGLVWLGLLNNYSQIFTQLAVYGFIFFAFIFWPAYIPVCMYRLEQNKSIQKILKIFMMIGLGTAALLLERVVYFGITAQLASCHINYSSHLGFINPVLTYLLMISYLLVTVGAMLVSTYPKMRIMGILVGLTYLITHLFYFNFLISVWCFFAAITSLLVYWLVKQDVMIR